MESDSSFTPITDICDSSTILCSFNHYDYVRTYSPNSKNYHFNQNSFDQEFDPVTEEAIRDLQIFLLFIHKNVYGFILFSYWSDNIILRKKKP